MITAHDILRDRLLLKAGLVEYPKITLDDIFKKQWNPDFEAKMRNRLAMGYFRYGSLSDQIGRHNFDNVASIQHRLDAYQKDRNREHLVDIANLCLVEFTVHPDYPFIAADDGVHTPKRK